MLDLSPEFDTAQNQKFVNKLVEMRGGVSPAAIDKILPVIEKIRALKKQKNAVVLAHYYMSPVLQVSVADGGIADFVGDSLALSVAATKVEADNIIFCGVHFMAETAHIINPSKNVYIPANDAGCSLASSITGADVRKLKEQHPGVPVIAYINTYAETKAEVDICCTSRNALKIAKSFDSDKLIFLPDMFMGQNLQEAFRKETNKELILWNGKCEVHEQFTENIGEMSEVYPEAEMLLHWEVPGETV
ncbi:MAG: quinolinate synthase, partial [Bacteroidia bacterium]